MSDPVAGIRSGRRMLKKHPHKSWPVPANRPAKSALDWLVALAALQESSASFSGSFQLAAASPLEPSWQRQIPAESKLVIWTGSHHEQKSDGHVTSAHSRPPKAAVAAGMDFLQRQNHSVSCK